VYINQIGFLTAIDKTIICRSVEPLKANTVDELLQAVTRVVRVYNKAQHTISVIDCDREFGSILTDVEEILDIKLNLTNADDHVPEIERNNRFLKERFRAIFNSLPYKAIPLVMIRYLLILVARQANFFPQKQGISTFYSPRLLIDRKPLIYERDCRYNFGSYVQANQPTTNTPRARTRDAIYLCSSTSSQGGHIVMALDTGKVLHCRSVVVTPATDFVIKAVENMAR
jgi:hypothetical protein